MSYTGTYVYRDGKIIKISDKAYVGDLWYKKYQINAESDIKAAYKSLEEQGKLNEVNDREVWGAYR